MKRYLKISVTLLFMALSMQAKSIDYRDVRTQVLQADRDIHVWVRNYKSDLVKDGVSMKTVNLSKLQEDRRDFLMKLREQKLAATSF